MSTTQAVKQAPIQAVEAVMPNKQAMRSWLEVSLGRIRGNYRAVQQTIREGGQGGRTIEVMPVVKADAYGHGALEVARVLEDEGATWLAVSNVEEGIALRLAGIKARILVMADFLPGPGRAALKEFALTPVIHSLADLAHVDVPYHLKIDTGMGRLGTRASAEAIVKAVSATSARMEGLMTHFASSANFENPQTDDQIAQFERVVAALRVCGLHPRYIHTASTNVVAYPRSATLDDSADSTNGAWGNLVRPGHAIYGYVPVAKGTPPTSKIRAPRLQVQPALSWKATVLAINEVETGARIGYGGIHRADRPMRLAILAAGYADGIPHRLGNRGQVIAGPGILAPIIGAVSMDLTTIDATSAPHLKIGDSVMLLGELGGVSINAQQMARVAGTISYSVLCGISARVKRVYTD
ncbi:MAG: alanine racemase [Acidobacteriota bacterium]